MKNDVEQKPKPDFHYHLVLLEPLIPPNTGNAGRLCVATQCSLHLIEPLGFSVDDKQVRRAGLDYWKFVDLHVHPSFESWLKWHRANEGDAPFFLVEDSKRQTSSIYDMEFPKRAAFVFGKETLGLPQSLLEQHENRVISVPMFSSRIRSLNLSNAVSIVLYEAIRQQLCKKQIKKEARAFTLSPSSP